MGPTASRQERRHPTSDAQLVTRRLWPMSEAAHQLGITRKHVYELLARGEIASVRMGRRRFITNDELDRFVAALSDG